MKCSLRLCAFHDSLISCTMEPCRKFENFFAVGAYSSLYSCFGGGFGDPLFGRLFNELHQLVTSKIAELFINF